MFLRDIFKRVTIVEGGNLELPNTQDANNPHRADEIDLKVHNRSYIVPILEKLLQDINNSFKAKYKTPIWSQDLLSSKQFLGGSSLHFFNTKGINDQQFTAKKPKVGDIDTQCNKEQEEQIKEFLTSYTNKQIGDTTLLGFSSGNEQFNALFQFQDPPMKIQVDFEFGRYTPETNTPDEWFRFSHNSEWNDIDAGIKGVFHKYLYRSLSGLSAKQAYIAKLAGRGKARAVQISDEPENVNTVSFAVSSKQGGGVSEKYKPYIDPATNQPMIKNGLPVLEPVAPADRQYEQKLATQFEMFFGRAPSPEDSKLQQSFIGTLDLINKYVEKSKKAGIVQDFLDICFEQGSQMITRDDPRRDAETKFMAIDVMLNKLGMMSLRPKAIEMAKAYEQDYNDVEAFKKANPGVTQPRAAMKKMAVKEAEGDAPAVKAQLRKGMPHLRDLKPADFLDLIDELHDGNGNFKLQNIPLNVKIDGFGGRFGKNADGKPFMGTSRTEPRYEPGFLKYHQEKGTTDPEILGRARSFDKLFDEMMNAIKVVDNALGADFLKDRQVTCEVLFLPFATQTEEGKLKFVGIEYDQLPKGVNLVLVPFRIVEGSTGEDIPDSDRVIQELSNLGQNGSVVFMSNRLAQKQGLDVTEIINPLDNIEELKQIVSGAAGKRDKTSLQLRREVEEKLKPVQIALEKAIDEDPNIIGKDLLGQDYEGIVINSRLGPIKVTSQRQKDIITAKNAAKKNARTERPRSENKTAVVAIGSFVGHKGHQQLFDYTIKKAKELNGDPYLFMGNAVGKDDPIPVADKIKTWQMLYPQYANNISAVTMEGGTLMQKIKHELINPLPGKLPRYDNIIIMVGEDQAKMPIAGALMKAVNKFPGYENVKVHLEVTPRGTGMSFTKLRDILKTGNPDQAFQLWNDAFNGGQFGAKQLPPEWIRHLMDVTRNGMGIKEPQQQQPAPQPVAEQRLFNSLLRPQIRKEKQGVAEGSLNELDMFAPRTVYFKMADGKYIKADYRGSEGLSGHTANDNVTFTSMSWVPPNTAKTLGLDKFLAQGSNTNSGTVGQNAQGIVGTNSAGEGPLGNRTIDVVDFVNGKEDTVPSALKTQVMQWVQKNQSKPQTPAEGLNDPWGPQGNFAGDKPFDLGGVSMKTIQIGDTVKYLGQKAKVHAMSKDRKYSRITILSDFGGTTKDVLTSDLQQLGRGIAEAPIGGPNDNPMIYGHQGANPAELKTRIMRARGQIKDLSQRSDTDSLLGWEGIARNFPELAMNIEQIRHAIEELAKKRKKGGIGSRGIDPNISAEESYDGGSYTSHKPGFGGQGRYTDSVRTQFDIGENKLVPIGEDLELTMAKAVLKLMENTLK